MSTYKLFIPSGNHPPAAAPQVSATLSRLDPPATLPHGAAPCRHRSSALHSGIALALLFLSAAPLAAQAVSGTIQVVVKDGSGASIQGAKVTVTNTNTNYGRQLETGASGDARFASMPLGPYRVSVENAGFETFSQEGVTLQVDQQVRVDVALRVGQVSDRVVVTAEAPIVNATNGEISQVVERAQVEQLPLNGRNFTQLIQLTTGTTTGATGDTQNNLVINQFRGPTNFTANGMRTLYNNYVLDGIDNNESAWNFGGVVILPVVDAIQEFKVSTGGFSSEFGRAAGGVVNVQTRSGTNQFHGNLFEFFRNDRLDANDFFNNAAGRARPAFRQNQFGGTFGGPLQRNKLFFFGDYQGTRMRRELTFLTSVPTMESRTGDFTNSRFPAIFDPATTRANPSGGVTRDPFPDRRVPSNRFDPLSQRFLEFFPAPNTNPGAIALNFLNNPKWRRQSDQGDLRLDYSLGNRGMMFGRYSRDHSNQYFPNDLTTASNPFGGGGRGNSIDLIAQNAAYNLTYLARPNLVLEGRLGFSRFDFAGLPLGAGDPRAANLQAPGVAGGPGAVSATNLSIPGLTAFGPTTGVPNFSAQTTFQYVFNTTYTRGRHTIKSGADFRRLRRNNFFVSTQPAAAFSFSPNWTSQTGAGGGGQAIATFLLGLPDTIQRGRINGGVGRRNVEFGSYVQDDWKVTDRLSLALGLRYDLYTPWYEVHDRMSMLDINTGKVVLPGASPYGRGLRQRNPANFAPRVGFAYRLPDKLRTVVRAGYAISYIEEFNGNGSNPIQNPPNSSTQNQVYSTTGLPVARFRDGVPAPAPLDLNNPSGLYRFVVPHGVPANAQQWDFSIQREFGRNWLFEAAYVGAKGTHLLVLTDPNQPVPGSTPIAQRRPLFSRAPNVTTTVGDSIGNSTYHSGQFKVQKRMANGFHALLSYTWAKALSDGESDLSNGTPGLGRFGMAQNALNRAAEKGLSDTDVPHRFIASYGYELPFGKGKRYGGWQLSGIVTLSSGNPFDLTMNTTTVNTGTAQRPNRIANGSVDEWTLSRYFDLSAFTTPAAFTWGNAGRNVLRGPGINTFDISVIKDTRFGERYNLQWRTDFFNGFNTPQFNPPNNSIGTPQAGTISSTRFSTNRQVQFVLKLFF